MIMVIVVQWRWFCGGRNKEEEIGKLRREVKEEKWGRIVKVKTEIYEKINAITKMSTHANTRAPF